MNVYLALGWLVFLIDVAAAGAFTVAAVVWAKRVGGAAPWLLGCVGLVDVLLLLVSRLMQTATSASHSSYMAQRTAWDAFTLVDATASFASGILALVAFALLMPKTPR